MKSTKKALFTSVLCLLLCVSMLIGTTFAWFTDTVQSGVNQIVAGNLDVELYRQSGHIEKEKVTEHTDNLFKDVTLWEPGAYAYETFTVENVGTLALKYKMNLNVAAVNSWNGHDLSEVIKVAVSDTVPADRAAAAALTGYTTLDSWVLNGSETLYPDGDTEPSKKTFTVVLYWEPTDNDNLFNVNNENVTTNSNPLGITIGVNLFATQVEHENDSFGTDYDGATSLPVNTVVKGNLNVAEDGGIVTTVGEQTIQNAETNPTMTVKYPVGVKLANHGEVTTDGDVSKTDVSQKFEFKSDTASSAMSAVTITDGKSVASYELTLPVASDNDVPVTVTLKYTPGLTGVKIYHSGEELTATANTNGEFAVYDPAGTLTLTLKHASPIDIVYDTVACTHEFENGVCTKCGEKDYAAKVNGQRFMTLGEALSNAQAGSTVIMLKDYEPSVTINKAITLDFNGCAITGTGDSNTAVAVLNIGADVTLTDTSANANGGVNTSGMNRAAIRVNDGTLTIEAGKYVSDEGYVVNVKDNKALVINGGTFNKMKENSNSTWNRVIMMDDNASVTITGGNFYGCGDRPKMVYIDDATNNTVTISGGTFVADALTRTNGSSFSGGYANIVYADSDVGGTVTITGGDFTLKGAQSKAFNGGKSSGYSVNVSGGKFSLTGDMCTVFSNDAFTVTGGSFTLNPGTYGYGYILNGQTVAPSGKVSGGTFSFHPGAFYRGSAFEKNDDSVLAGGCTATESNGSWTVAAN